MQSYLIEMIIIILEENDNNLENLGIRTASTPVLQCVRRVLVEDNEVTYLLESV